MTYNRDPDTGVWRLDAAATTVERFVEDVDFTTQTGQYAVPGNRWTRANCPRVAMGDSYELPEYASVIVHALGETGASEEIQLDLGDSTVIDVAALLGTGATKIFLTVSPRSTALSIVGAGEELEQSPRLDIDVTIEKAAIPDEDDTGQEEQKTK
jgi:hypothetical protein